MEAHGPTINITTMKTHTLNTDPIAWSDGLLLGYTPMDRVHEEFVDCVAALQAGPDDQLLHQVRRLQQHLDSHFGEENRWMEDNNFPAKECHFNEHAAVQKSVAEVLEEMELGIFSNARRLADELANWFPGHATYLDSALAHWMCKLSLGGKPVVLRRSVGQHGVQPSARV